MGLLTPKLKIRYLRDLNLKELKKAGFRVIFLDYDNTLAPWRGKTITEDAKEFISQAKELGIHLVLVSNAKGNRAKKRAKELDLLYYGAAYKPWPKAYKVGLDRLNLKREEALSIGDQIFTDVLGSNFAGIKSILINPISSREFIGTKLFRFFERIIGVKVVYKEDDR